MYAIATIYTVNDYVASSRLGRWFQLDGSGHPRERKGSRFTTEIRAGLTTWAAMAYIISVNAAVITDSGATCVCPHTSADPSCNNDQTYLTCLADVQRDLVTTTAAIAAASSFLMGALANLPVGMAPGLSLNSYFAYSVVGYHGTGMITYREALGAVFLEGWIFLLLSILGLRQWLARIMPHSLILALSAGIGLFISLLGLSSSGLDVVGGSTTDLLALGGCEPKDYVDGLEGFCNSKVLRDPTVWFGAFMGGFLTVLLMMYRVKGALLIGILLTSFISWPRGTAITFFPYTETGNAAFDYFKKVVTFHPLEKVGGALDLQYRNPKVWYALITFLYVDILDTTGTLYSMARFCGLRDPATGDFEGSTMAYCVDAFCISMGALMGTSPVSAFIESATGISEGGKTGITAIVTSLAFFISVFFSPLFSSIPPWATGGALVIVGSLMIRNVTQINWAYMGDAIPAFLTLIIVPFTRNVAYGVIVGVGSYVLLNGIPHLIRLITRDRITPPSYDVSEPWIIPPGGIVPIWVQVLKRRYDGALQPKPDVPSLNEAVRLEVAQQPQPATSNTNIRTAVHWANDGKAHLAVGKHPVLAMSTPTDELHSETIEFSDLGHDRFSSLSADD